MTFAGSLDSLSPSVSHVSLLVGSLCRVPGLIVSSLVLLSSFLWVAFSGFVRDMSAYQLAALGFAVFVSPLFAFVSLPAGGLSCIPGLLVPGCSFVTIIVTGPLALFCLPLSHFVWVAFGVFSPFFLVPGLVVSSCLPECLGYWTFRVETNAVNLGVPVEGPFRFSPLAVPIMGPSSSPH